MKIVNKLNAQNCRAVLMLETIPLLVVQVILIKTTVIETQVLDWIIIAEVMHTHTPPTHPPTHPFHPWAQSSSTYNIMYGYTNLQVKYTHH
jgi:hypothetical protein